MRTDYPKFERGELEKIFSKLNSKEKQTIKEFISYCGISAGKRKTDDVRRSLIQFRYIIGKDFDKITLDDLRGFLSILNKSDREKYTQNGIKVYIKRFLRWKFKDWVVRFDELKDIKLVKAFNEKKINENTLLKKEQIESIMNKEKDITKKTFFITLYESGLRPIELRNLKWKDITFNINKKGLSKLSIYATKTAKSRSVFIQEATYWLEKLREEKQSDYVFYSRENKNTCISKSLATLWIQQMGKKIGIKIFPYLLRHTRATELYKTAPAKIVQKFLGHSREMSDLYSHLSSEDVEKMVSETIYDVEHLTPEKKADYEARIKDMEARLKRKEEKDNKKFKLITEVIDELIKTKVIKGF